MIRNWHNQKEIPNSTCKNRVGGKLNQHSGTDTKKNIYLLVTVPFIIRLPVFERLFNKLFSLKNNGCSLLDNPAIYFMV